MVIRREVTVHELIHLFLLGYSYRVSKMPSVSNIVAAPSGVPGGGWGWELGGSNPPEISKAFQNRAKFNPIVKTVKNR